MHNQLYRPTEAETQAQLAEKSKRPSMNEQGKQDSLGKLKVGERVEKVEKGVGRFLKKLDSKW